MQLQSSDSHFKEVLLPENLRQNREIYAFWHTKKQAKVDVYVKNLVKAEIQIFNFLTSEGMERLKLQHIRNMQKKGLNSINEEDDENETIKEIQLQSTINLNIDFLFNRRLTNARKDSKHKTLNTFTTHDDNDDESFKSEDLDHDSEEDGFVHPEGNQESSDDEGYESDKMND